jgi:hypothetical protein
MITGLARGNSGQAHELMYLEQLTNCMNDGDDRTHTPPRCTADVGTVSAEIRACLLSRTCCEHPRGSIERRTIPLSFAFKDGDRGYIQETQDDGLP